ncbi:MAG TPA: hypothetical protein VM115_09815 [Vicinamibacterales bacterium]|nr:hypothetical protein [Vicinamibacterales bacterium]
MIWFSGDSADRILYEIRHDERGFELRLIHSSGRREVERFQDAAELARGASKIQSELRSSGWRTSYRRD